MTTQKTSWADATHQRIADAIKAARKGKYSAEQIADQCAELGHPISRAMITNFETNRKQSLTVAELLVIAMALGVPPVALIYPGLPDEVVELVPGQEVRTFQALAWFSGDRDLGWPSPDVDPDEARELVDDIVGDPDSRPALILMLTRKRAVLHRQLALQNWAIASMVKTLPPAERERFNVTVDAEAVAALDEINDYIGRLARQEDS